MKSVVHILLVGVFVFPLFLSAQEEDDDSAPSVLDSLYREDQFYLGFSYNILTDMPEGISASGFSGGLELGFIRDFPINERRNIAFGTGFGWSFNNYGQNLFIGEEPDTETTVFQLLDDSFIEYDKNRFSMQAIDIPLQFRWRTSKIDTYKFWRIYTGIKMGYVYYFRSNFEQPENTVRQTEVPEFKRLRWGATFAFGYNTFNFHFYYSLNPFFDDKARLGGEEIEMRSFQVGLMFYLL